MKKNNEKIRGLLYGVALGDAFGMPTEMLSRQVINEMDLDFSRPFESLDISIISKNRPAYSITDDTMNTLMIMEMLKENNGVIDTNIYLEKLKNWTYNSPIAGYVTGPSTSRALREIKNGKSIEESGMFGTTNGAAMKISPIGLVSNYQNKDELIENVVNICKPTHNTSIALSGASVIAAVVSYFYCGGDSFDKMYEIAYEISEKSKNRGFQWPSASLKHRINLAREIVDFVAVSVSGKNGVFWGAGVSEQSILTLLYNEVGCSMETIDTVPVALALVYLSKGDALKCAQLAAEIGGDTDTIGSIATSICGVYRPETIPQEMIEEIEKVNNINFDNYIY